MQMHRFCSTSGLLQRRETCHAFAWSAARYCWERTPRTWACEGTGVFGNTQRFLKNMNGCASGRWKQKFLKNKWPRFPDQLTLMLFCTKDPAGHDGVITGCTQTYGKWQVTVIYFQVFLQLGNFGISYHFCLMYKSFYHPSFPAMTGESTARQGNTTSQSFPTAQEESEGTSLLPLMGKVPIPKVGHTSVATWRCK